MRTSRGFTLLELLVVVVIIGILASLAIPRFIKTTEQARTAEAKQWLGQIRSSEIRYNLENGSYVTGSDLSKLDIDDPNAPAQDPAYYTYAVAAGACSCASSDLSAFCVTATRTTGTARGRPDAPTTLTNPVYTIDLSEKGTLCGGP